MTIQASQATQVQDLARTWAKGHDSTLEALTPAAKRAVVVDVAKRTGISQVDVMEALLSLWTAANEIRGRSFNSGGPAVGDARRGFKPMASAKGQSPTSMLLTNRTLATNIAVFQPVPDDSPARKLANDGFALDKAGNPHKAIELYQQAIGEEPADPMIRNRLGLATKHLGPGHLGEALALIDGALAIDPKHAPSNYNAACISAQNGDLAGAAKHLARSIAADEKFFVELAQKDKDFAGVGGPAAVIAAAQKILHPDAPTLDASKAGDGVVKGSAEPGARVEARVSPDHGDMLSTRADVFSAVVDKGGRFSIQVPTGSVAVVRILRDAEAGLDAVASKPVTAHA